MDAPRFDAVAKALAAHTPRRRLPALLAALGLGGAALGRGHPAVARAVAAMCGDEGVCCDQSGHCWCCGMGIAGAGIVAVAGLGATFTLFAARLALAPAAPVSGHLWWADPSWAGPAGERGLELASTRIEAYGPLAGQEEVGREVRGVAAVTAGDSERAGVPFVLHAVAGAAAGGEDRLRLWVGDAIPAELGPPAGTSGLGYAAEGPLALGSLTLLRFDQPAAGAGTPTA